jgi:LPXTG-site transpeptidase (sortase) family protein
MNRYLKQAKDRKTTPLRQFNNLLSLVIFVLALYIIVAPFTPQLSYYWQHFTNKNDGIKYSSSLATETLGEAKAQTLQAPPTDNHLVIPTIGVDSLVNEGTDPNLLNLGLWHRPNTSTPDKGSNTVVVAHRFQYTSGPATFYSLDKVAVGDKALLFWGNPGERYEYLYEAVSSDVVSATAVEIENSTTDPMLTLYTCTPIWTAKDRLVVKFKLIKKTKI